ncbi:MAG: S-layer homology domain-containing protein, partial [Tissierellia bacterium]|nr:S-layer homology domain-containing protein [Tissierellia bacterium]
FTPPDPYLEFVEDPYSVQLGKTIQAEVNYFDGEDDFDVTNYVGYNSADPEIATISTSGAITGVSVGTTTVSAIYVTGVNGSSTTYSAFANVIVSKRSESRPSPSPQKTIIGQIIIDGKVIKDIYAEDLVSDGGIYSFEATKTGDNAKLWLLGSYYKQIANKNSSGTLQLIWDAASYNLPLKSEEVLKEVNNIAGSKVNIILEKVDDEKVIDSATVAVDKLGGKMVSGLVDFSVTVEGKSKEVNIDKYNMYVTRTMDNLNNLDAYSTTAMKLIEDEFTFAPSVFGNNAATIKYRGNGIFAIVNNPKSFSDIANHWSKMNVEKLAARNIAFGKNEGIFAPNDYVTRAEFAVMITRALAITEEEGTMNFEDVNGWYEEDISTAYDAGLINGRSDGKFYQNEKIQRKDMTVMIQNALKFAGKGEAVKNKDSVLSMFTDSSEIDEYAKESTAICADAGIIMGRDTKEFDPDENATRAEASAIIERMLRYLEFIN